MFSQAIRGRVVCAAPLCARVAVSENFSGLDAESSNSGDIGSIENVFGKGESSIGNRENGASGDMDSIGSDRCSTCNGKSGPGDSQISAVTRTASAMTWGVPTSARAAPALARKASAFIRTTLARAGARTTAASTKNNINIRASTISSGSRSLVNRENRIGSDGNMTGSDEYSSGIGERQSAILGIMNDCHKHF